MPGTHCMPAFAVALLAEHNLKMNPKLVLGNPFIRRLVLDAVGLRGENGDPRDRDLLSGSQCKAKGYLFVKKKGPTMWYAVFCINS